VDDVDKFLGKSDIRQGERILEGKCLLKMIITCRAGRELDQVRSDRDLPALLDRFSAVTCSDFRRQELISLAQQVGKPVNPDLYDLTPGSVLLGLTMMRKRLEAAATEAQAVMKAMFLLRTALIFSPEEKLVTAVLTEIFRLQVADKIDAAVRILVLDGFLRRGRSLATCHDCYLTTDSFSYYSVLSPELEEDLISLGVVLENSGTGRDFQSLGVYWRTRENYGRALPFLQKAADSDPTDVVLAFDLGIALFHTHRFDESVKAFQKVLLLNPDHAAGRNSLGVALGQLNRSEEAIQAYDEDLRRFGEAPESALREQVARALVNKGVALGQLNRSEEAIQAYDAALRRFGDAPGSALREQVARALVNKGAELGQLNRSEEAIQAYDAVLRRFGDAPESALREPVAEALVNKGLTLGQLNRSEEAIQACDEVLRRFGDAPEPALREWVAEALFHKANLIASTGDLAGALATYDDAIHALPCPFGKAA
jgi:tetratricopeptide (TPR) repeat protein